MIVVRRDRQGQGRSAALLRGIEEDLRERDQRLLLVETSGVPGFARTRAFYRRCGYTVAARVAGSYAAGDDMILYCKDLSASKVTAGSATAAEAGVAAESDDPGALLVSGSPAPMRLRAALPGDLDRRHELAVAFYAEDGFLTSPSDLRARLQVLLGEPSARTAVVERDGALLAFAVTTTAFRLESGLTAELQDLFVLPSARRKRLAPRLIDDSAAWAKAHGCNDLELVVAPQGRHASHLHAYYQQQRFHDDGRRLLSRSL